MNSMSQVELEVALSVGLAVGIPVCLEVGFRVGKRYMQRDPESAHEGIGAIEAAVFALLGLLLAFTYARATDRLVFRRNLIGGRGQPDRSSLSPSGLTPCERATGSPALISGLSRCARTPYFNSGKCHYGNRTLRSSDRFRSPGLIIAQAESGRGSPGFADAPE